MNKTYYAQFGDMKCVVKPTIFMAQLDTLYLSIYVNHRVNEKVYGTILWNYTNNLRVVEWLQLRKYDKITFAIDLQDKQKTIYKAYPQPHIVKIPYRYLPIYSVEDAIHMLQSAIRKLYTA